MAIVLVAERVKLLPGLAKSVPPLIVIFGLAVSSPKLLSALKPNIPLFMVVPPE